jgi:hypothetical protein
MTEKDPRIERVRRMVPDRTTWPGGRLCMKRIVDGQIIEFGMMAPRGSGSYFNICVDDPHEALCTYANLDDLIAAGWRVD